MLTTGPNLPVVHLSREAKTVGDMFRKRARASADYPAFHTKRDGAWVATSWREFFEQASAVARGLVALGLEPGDRVGILGPTLAPWAIQDMAAQLAGLVSFGIYPMQSPDQIRYLLAHSDARVVFVANSEELEHVLEAAEGLEHLVAIVPWEHALYEQYADRDPRLRSIHDFEGAPLDDATLEARLRARKPEDLAVLVYTSGTTGPPKGAMISHRNILELLASEDTLELRQNDLSLNFLPMAHVAERLLGFYGRIDVGLTTAYASSISAVLPELLEVRPTLFGSVPRIFEKAYGKIHSEIERKPAAVQRLFRWAKAVGIERVRRRLANQSVPLRLELQHRVADRLVFRKIRGVFGGRVRIFITGAAPTALEILEFFWAAGMPIYEVYGMTEATVMTHCNREGAVRLGTVGRPMREIECRLADDGEILIRGPWVFVGYFKDESATSRTVVDGWLHTGDIGEIDGDGYLKITDRKKHLIITAGGKNLAPANIEKAIKSTDPLISQVHAHGDRRPFVSAIIAPSPIETLEWGRDHGLVDAAVVEAHTRELLANPTARSEALNADMARVIAHPEFRQRLQAAVARGNRELARVEQVRKFVILDRDFSQEQGELTPTMKVKRKTLEEKFCELLAQVYDDAHPDVGLEPR